MLLLIKYTLLYGIVLMLVALGGKFSEHSGIINIALEGIMVIGGVAGVLTLTMLPADMSPFLEVLLTILAAARNSPFGSAQTSPAALATYNGRGAISASSSC